MVNRDVVAIKIGRARGWLTAVARLAGRSRTELLSDTQGRDLLAFYLMLAIQEVIDLAAHWVADEGLRPPDDAASSFDLLAERALIEQDLADHLRAAVGLRNRIAHGYALLDHGRLYDEVNAGQAHLQAFLTRLAQELSLR